MLRTGKANTATLMVAGLLAITIISAGICLAQLEGLEGMEAPEDVSGVECAMCHGDFASSYDFTHEPALEGDCVACHESTGVGGHGELVSDDRGLCLACHVEQLEHYPVLNCWAISCHSQPHGSDSDPLLNPNRQEEYPGFFESTDYATYTVYSNDCIACHPQTCSAWGESVHSLSELDDDLPPSHRGCESCHGPAGDHWGRRAGIGIFEYASAEEADTVCLVCHADETFIPEYERTIHAKTGVACVSCHNPHNVNEKHNLRFAANEVCFACHETKRIDFNKFSHHPVDLGDPRTGLQCTDCHNPHGGDGAAMLAVDRGELCLECHVDKRGPFVYAMPGYDPDLGRGCLSCHAHHGANSPNLLNLSGRAVCLQCHTDRVTHGSPQLCWTSGCHSEHHGSNASYFFFNR